MMAQRLQAAYLPDIANQDVAWHVLQFGNAAHALEVALPQLSQLQLEAITRRVQAACQTQLKSMSVCDIVSAIDRAIAKLLDTSDPRRKLLDTVLPIISNMDKDLLQLSLSQYFKTFRALQLHRFVAEDFANPQILDAFQPRVTGGWSKAMGPDLAVHVWAGNVPALPLWSMVSGLLVKSGCIGKVSSAEPVFAAVFAEVLVEVEPRFKNCFAIIWWPNEDTTTARYLFNQAEVVVAYGASTTLAVLQNQTPSATRFLAHGHKLSFGMVAMSALSVLRSKRVANEAALDVVRFEQQGCYSPHMFYVERGAKVSPYEFAEHLRSSIAAVAKKFPRPPLTLEEAASVVQWREKYALSMVQTSATQVLGDATDAFTVVYSDTPIPLEAGPSNRCVVVVAVDKLTDVIPLLQRQKNYLQTVGLAVAPEELLHLGDALAQAGATRICAIGNMCSPAAGWHHDGRFSLSDLVRLVDIEASTEIESERFTQYEL